eukprot:Gb_11907 [translate_table: standard]
MNGKYVLGNRWDLAFQSRMRAIAELVALSLAVAVLGVKVEFGYDNNAENAHKLDTDTNGICTSRVVIYGYPCEEYTLNTEDGYILGMQRIPHGLSNKDARDRQPVLLQHGVLMDGVTWLINPPEQSLAFILADKGFDVWIANSRGTKWSRKHQHLSPQDPAYWEWTWDELVTYDLPASLEFVYSKTGRQISYIGHSQGTLIALAAFSQGKLLDTVKSAVFLSPIAHLNHITTVLGRLAADALMGEIVHKLGVAEFDPAGPAVANFLNYLCSQPGANCFDLLTAITGSNCCLNSSGVDMFLEYEPQSTSTLNMVHLAQMVRRGSVSMYDYGFHNRKHYNQTRPPAYNLTNIPTTLPIFVGYGGKDALSDPRDVELLLDSLGSQRVNQMTVLYLAEYAHADFVMAVSANQEVYKPIISFLSKY